MSGKFGLCSPLGAEYNYVDMRCNVVDHSACKAINLAAAELACHADVIAGFDRAKDGMGTILEGTIIRVRFRAGVTFDQKSSFVTTFVADMNAISDKLYLPETVDLNQVRMSGAVSLLRD